jgi:hypothetical protein
MRKHATRSIADDRNFFKVEQWSHMRVERLLYAGNSLAKAEDIFARAIKHRPPSD